MNEFIGVLNVQKVRESNPFLIGLECIKYQKHKQNQSVNALDISYIYMASFVDEQIAHLRVIVECRVMKTSGAIEAHGVVDNLFVFLNEINCNFPISFGGTKENRSDFTEC